MFEVSPTLVVTKKHVNLLGDMTLYRVNKEFENFWEALGGQQICI